MRALAEFIMRSRFRAAVVAVIGNWVPLLTPATVALVTLRAGWHNGLLVLLWGVLPAILTLGFSQIDALLPMAVIGGVALTFVTAQLLKLTASWSHSLMATVALATLIALLQQMFAPQTVEMVTENLNRMGEHMQSEGAEEQLQPIGDGATLGWIAYGVAFSSVLGLVLGRWWQAMLYNPGGFAEEFQAVRLNQPQAIVCLLAGLYALFQGPDYEVWSSLFTLPLLFVGLALVHRIAAIKQWATHWLVLFYAALLILDPVSQLLVVLAFLDTWLNFRGRIKPNA